MSLYIIYQISDRYLTPSKNLGGNVVPQIWSTLIMVNPRYETFKNMPNIHRFCSSLCVLNRAHVAVSGQSCNDTTHIVFDCINISAREILYRHAAFLTAHPTLYCHNIHSPFWNANIVREMLFWVNACGFNHVSSMEYHIFEWATCGEKRSYHTAARNMNTCDQEHRMRQTTKLVKSHRPVSLL